ncbi:Na(+)/citrate cotransporter-like isoform X2 [Ornithodoros turicata]|uniref:Na(+)/citrate cotransporter-like isoform X2 n=1 Tax=Ornithodoros turicata TaxID=34597 RepID=UPI0031391BD3
MGRWICTAFIIRNWHRVLALASPIALALIFLISDSKEARCLYGILIIIIFWMFELLPLPVTSLLPVFIFPSLGILTTTESTAPYMQDVVMMLLGSMILAMAVDHCNLHYRIALRILLHTGTSTMRVLLGFMLSTVLLSMWLNNTATALIVVPIADAVSLEIGRRGHMTSRTYESGPADESWRERLLSVNPLSTPLFELQPTSTVNQHHPQSTSVDYTMSPELRELQNAILLGVTYATSIGGTGSIFGTSPNYVFLGLVEQQYPEQTDVSLATWMIYNVPPMLVCTLFAWLYVYYYLVPRRYHGCDTDGVDLRFAILKQYDELGHMTFHEGAVLAIFALTATAQFFRDPVFFPGWSSHFALANKIRDATPSMLGVCLLFLIPARPRKNFPGPALLNWPSVQRKMPWGIVLFVGGSFSVAAASEASGLPLTVASKLAALKGLPSVALVAIMTTLTSAITEVCSNTATASVMLSVSSYMARAIRIHPLYLMIPVTVAASFSFVLPAGTPPNTLVYHHGRMNIYYMVRSGLIMNAGCIFIEMIFITTFGFWIFDLKTFPSWADSRNYTSVLHYT